MGVRRPIEQALLWCWWKAINSPILVCISLPGPSAQSSTVSCAQLLFAVDGFWAYADVPVMREARFGEVQNLQRIQIGSGGAFIRAWTRPASSLAVESPLLDSWLGSHEGSLVGSGGSVHQPHPPSSSASVAPSEDRLTRVQRATPVPRPRAS